MSEQPVDVDVDVEVPESDEPVESFDEDVDFCLASVTDDGPGDLENLPPSDFDGFASDDVEEEQL